MYTDDKNAQVVIALLKEYGIKKIVISPGTTNVPISRSVQIDPWFEVYSVVDERSAAYFATGLAHESGEPVVISCTGATASRNYLSALTEAYYRNLPVIALTSQHHVSDYDNLVPQVTDRTVSQNDVKKLSVNLPIIKDEEDYDRCVLSVNKALMNTRLQGGGPVHINLHVVGDYSFTTPELPKVRKIEAYNNYLIQDSIDELSAEIASKKVGVFIGAHRKFSKRAEAALEAFAEKYNIPIFVDQTSSYKGSNAVLIAQIADLKHSASVPELIIDMGSISGEYSAGWLKGIETWRLSEDEKNHDRFGLQTKLFYGPEEIFFETMTATKLHHKEEGYYDEIKTQTDSIVVPIDEMPLSNTYVSYKLSTTLPDNSLLHLGILNSLRNMNFYKTNPTVDMSSNVGGFGIDGALSTLIGQSMVNKQKLSFGLVGDLASFYDMNALGIRHISNNLRVLVVNNNGGVEFRLNARLETQWANETDEFISAGGHNGSIKGWAESMGFVYMSANTKEEFDDLIKKFCDPNLRAFSCPVLFEVFTKIPDEQDAIKILQEVNRRGHLPQPDDEKRSSQDLGIKDKIKKATPKAVKDVYRKVRGKK